MSVAQRDSLLISVAEEVVLKYGPDYYRDYKEPVIKRGQVPPKGEMNPEGEMASRVYYDVTYLYDETQEVLSFEFAASVRFWADTGKPGGVTFGSGEARIIRENVDWRNDDTIEPSIYYQSVVIPIYDLNNPDPNQEPKNLDELKRRGYKDRGDGEWIKIQKDVPPPRKVKIKVEK